MVRLKVYLQVSKDSLDHYFNSKMVRLKAVPSPLPSSDCLFQFQDGSIKSLHFDKLVLVHKEFQFQDGSIKSCWRGYWLVFTSIFQFQDGSIKSIQDVSGLYPLPLFQFQDGSIKRIWWYRFIICCSYFNSKMVRLKGCS